MTTAIAYAGDHAVERLRLEWTAPDDSSQREIADEAIAAVAAFSGSWVDALALEARMGCYDREILTETSSAPPNEFRGLRCEPFPRDLEPRRYQHVSEELQEQVSRMSPDAIRAWIDRALARPCGPADRFETSLRNLYVQAARLVLPPHWATGTALALECYTGTIAVPIEQRSGLAWIAAPMAGYGLHMPLELHMDNVDDGLGFEIQIYWTPWVGELERPESALAQAVARLVVRGWQIAGQ